MATETNPLIGQTLVAIYLADDNQAIKFVIAGGVNIIARAEGDCCSHTWIENVKNAEALIGSPIVSVEDIQMPGEPDKVTGEYDDVIAYYGLKLTTAKGDCVLDYRNSSNGYYGGYLVWLGEYSYGGVFDQNVSTEVWKLIA